MSMNITARELQGIANEAQGPDVEEELEIIEQALLVTAQNGLYHKCVPCHKENVDEVKRWLYDCGFTFIELPSYKLSEANTVNLKVSWDDPIDPP